MVLTSMFAASVARRLFNVPVDDRGSRGHSLLPASLWRELWKSLEPACMRRLHDLHEAAEAIKSQPDQ